MKVCIEPGCPTLTTGRRCPTHTATTDHARGSRQARGYGREHTELRAKWAPLVATGMVQCTRCNLLIKAEDQWHLDHTDDRTGYRGPSHAHCNTSAGGRNSRRVSGPN